MSDARRIADRLTDAFSRGDLDAVTSCYASNAVVVAPEGTFKGSEQIEAFFRSWLDPFSDLRVDVTTKAAWADRTLDEWSLSCTNTGALELPTGDTLPATGRRVSVRGADVCTVEGDVIVEHHMYYDQVEFLGQLGLLPE